jgi:hypothetical protein
LIGWICLPAVGNGYGYIEKGLQRRLGLSHECRFANIRARGLSHECRFANIRASEEGWQKEKVFLLFRITDPHTQNFGIANSEQHANIRQGGQTYGPVTTPTFGNSNSMQISNDFKKALESYEEYNRQEIERNVTGGIIDALPKILTIPEHDTWQYQH